MQELLTPKDGWVVKKLGEVCEIKRGASPRPIESPIWFENNSNTGWLRISDVSSANKYLVNTTQQLSLLGVKNSRFIPKNNLIMSICATVGRPIINKIDVCIHDGFVVFNNLQLEKEYLYYYLIFIEKNWVNNGQVGSQMNLNTTLINSTEVPIPPNYETQKQISTILSNMDNEITVLEQKLNKYKNIKQGMMQDLLTGKVRLV